MAIPENPLDRYATYTYHFELHCADSWDKLRYLVDSDYNDVTEPNSPNGTLLINTRRDAHQTIDDVKYTYQGPFVDPTATSAAFTTLSLKVTEPGGVAFAEKLQRAARQWSVINWAQSMVFALKIIFVGRYSDNRIESEIPEARFGNVLPLTLVSMTGDYDYRGGEYAMTFSHNSTAANPMRGAASSGVANSVGYSHKNVSITAATVREAIEKLQDKLNENYRELFVEDKSKKPLEYVITLDPELDGKLYLISTETYAPEEEVKLSWHPEIQIIDMIKSILGSSKEVNEMITDSIDGIRRAHHPGVRVPTYSCRYEIYDDRAVVYYDVMLYEETPEDDEEHNFEFFCFYNKPGINVDVIDFEMKFNHMYAWLQNTWRNGVDFHTNISGQLSDADKVRNIATNTIHENKTQQRLEGNTPVPQELPGTDVNDVMMNPSNPMSENQGWIRHQASAAPVAKMAFSTLAEMHATGMTQATFDIRGHLGLLFRVLPDQDNILDNPGFGMKRGVWIKVHINDMNGQPFWYTGWYQLLSVDNVFSGGKFLQKLTVVMTYEDSLRTP